MAFQAKWKLPSAVTIFNYGVGKKIVDQEALFILYNSLITPHIEYCIEMWGNTAITKLKRIIALQKKKLCV